TPLVRVGDLERDLRADAEADEARGRNRVRIAVHPRNENLVVGADGREPPQLVGREPRLRAVEPSPPRRLTESVDAGLDGRGVAVRKRTDQNLGAVRELEDSRMHSPCLRW